jgi:hypothetical protein
VKPATIVAVDPSLKAGVKQSTKAYQNDLLGVVSTKPGQILADSSDQTPGSRPVNLALAGRVPLIVTPEGGSIKAGDMITSSSTPGKGMKANSSGSVVGRALTDYDASSGKEGVVVVFIEKGFNQAAVEADFEGLLSSDTVNVNYSADQADPLADAAQTAVTVSGKKYGAFNQEFVDNLMGALKNQQSQLNSQLAAINKLNEFTGINEPQSSTTEGSDLSSLKTRLDTLESKSTTVANTNSIANAVFNGGIVTGDVEFQGAATFIALTTFKGKTVFEGDVTFAGSLDLGRNTGKATVKSGTTKVAVKFEKPYTAVPNVVASPKQLTKSNYAVTDVTKEGFIIEIGSSLTSDVGFDWIATLGN